MADDRLYLQCLRCGDLWSFFKHYSGGLDTDCLASYAHSEGQDDWVERHMRECWYGADDCVCGLDLPGPCFRVVAESAPGGPILPKAPPGRTT